jgi:hypothetical protein
MYDTPEYGEVKRILDPPVSFFPVFLGGWHTNRFLHPPRTSGHPEPPRGRPQRWITNSLYANMLGIAIGDTSVSDAAAEVSQLSGRVHNRHARQRGIVIRAARPIIGEVVRRAGS